MKDLISIVVPVYNAEKTLSQCVRSLREQTHEHIEILLVNDGSKDSSLALCHGLAQEDPRIWVIDKPNGGVSSARNAGLDAATGDYVMFCDSDDWVEPDWCAVMLRNHVPGDMTVCGIAREDIPKPEGEVPPLEIAERKHFFHYPLLMCSPVNKLFDRSVVQAHGIRFPEQLHLGEDFAFVLAYLQKIPGKVRFLSRELYCYDVSVADSLTKRRASLEQCDLFGQLIQSATKALEITDEESLRIRDRFILTQFEGMLAGTAEDKTLSVSEKIARARRTEKLPSYRNCDGSMVVWGNPLYNWCFHRKHMVVLMWYLIARSAVKS